MLSHRRLEDLRTIRYFDASVAIAIIFSVTTLNGRLPETLAKDWHGHILVYDPPYLKLQRIHCSYLICRSIGEVRKFACMRSLVVENHCFEVLPQVAMKRGDDWNWIIEDDISRENLTGWPKDEVDVRIVCNSTEEFERLIQKLRNAGITFGKVTRYDISSPPDEGLRAIHGYELTHPQARCVAKIVFNYMASNLGPGPEFSLHESFDAVRAYIRYGDLCGQQAFVYLREQSLLHEERMGGKVTNGYILIVDWGVDSNHVVGHVALFNLIRYNIALSWKYVGQRPPLGIGHHFDVKSGNISKLDVVQKGEPLQ